MTRPFPDDPQWLQLSRKLPPDAVVACLIRFGFRPADIARRFDIHRVGVRNAARRAGIGPMEADRQTNGCRAPYRVRLLNPILCRQGEVLVYRQC